MLVLGFFHILQKETKMRGKYDSTVSPADQRVRSQKQTIVVPNNGVPSIEICEQRIILAGADDGTMAEQVLKELPAFSVDLTREILAEEFPELDIDDIPTGKTLTGNQAMLAYRSFVRHAQWKRDQRLITPPQEPEPPQ